MKREDAEKRAIREERAKWRLPLGLAVCVLLLIITGMLGLRLDFLREALHFVSDPIEQGLKSVQVWIHDHNEGWGTMQSVMEENARLREQVEALEEENRALLAEARRAEELEELYALDTYYRDYPKTGAQIIGLSPNNWYDTFILDKGSADGIEIYMPVITTGGLAGHVSEVFGQYAIVTSIVDQGSVIYGQINRPGGDLVVVEGAFGYHSNELGEIDDSLCMIKFVTGEVDITVGDEIVTSSLGDIYPPGLSIGIVTEIIPVGPGYESVAIIKPSVDLEQTDMVLIITEVRNLSENENGEVQP